MLISLVSFIFHTMKFYGLSYFWQSFYTLCRLSLFASHFSLLALRISVTISFANFRCIAKLVHIYQAWQISNDNTTVQYFHWIFCPCLHSLYSSILTFWALFFGFRVFSFDATHFVLSIWHIWQLRCTRITLVFCPEFVYVCILCCPLLCLIHARVWVICLFHPRFFWCHKLETVGKHGSSIFFNNNLHDQHRNFAQVLSCNRMVWNTKRLNQTRCTAKKFNGYRVEWTKNWKLIIRSLR